MKSALLVFVWLGFICTMSAQSNVQIPANRQPEELLIQLADDANIQNVVTALQANVGRANSIFLKKEVATSWHIYLLGFDENIITADALWSLVLHTPGIRTAQWNYRVQERDIPNDEKWSQQINMNLIHAVEAWEASTGGLTANGDTIVVAVLEKGALLSHPDLVDNIWRNWREIPGNHLDDDHNGYVDDYESYDVRFQGDGSGNVGYHGTAVNGIIGARGNNDIGVAGVNWNVKLMNFSNVINDAEIIRAYEYVAKMRRRYNETNGQEGAFVVATNNSFGFDTSTVEDHPLWCAAFDSVGILGVLSAGATANSNIDVEIKYDVPSNCTSEYLLTVNSVDPFTGDRSPDTGYGRTSVDLGAPGDRVYTTYSFDTIPDYNNFRGTSAATPHVSGAIALLYSLNCPALTSDALTQPAACARRVRDMILHNVEISPSLQGITTTGGRLDLLKCVNGVRELCNSSIGELQFLSVRHFPDNTLDVYFQTPTLKPYDFRIFNMLGQLMFETTLQPQEFAATHYVFDANYLPAGVYVLTLARNKTVITRKFPKI